MKKIKIKNLMLVSLFLATLTVASLIVPNIGAVNLSNNELKIVKNINANPNDNVSPLNGPSLDGWPMFQHDPQHTGFTLGKAPRYKNRFWEYSTGSSNIQESSPAISNGRIFVGIDQTLYCIDAFSGAELWEYHASDEIYSTPAIENGKIYFTALDGSMYCLNEQTGDWIWKVPGLGDIADSSPIIANNKIIYNYDNANSGILWIRKLEDPNAVCYFEHETGGGTPAYYAGKIYVADSKFLYCIPENDPDNNGYISLNEIYWLSAIPSSYSSPTISESLLYIGSDDGIMYCIDIYSKVIVWQKDVGNYPITTSPTVAYGKVFFGTLSNFFCLNAYTGDLIWGVATGEWIFSSPVVADQKVYFGICESGRVYCANVYNGNLYWQDQTCQGLLTSFAIAYGNCYINTNDGVIAYGSQKPNAPSIKGSLLCEAGTSYNFKFTATDPDNDDIYYTIDWGDNTVDENIGPFKSGDELIISHVWNEKGTFEIKAKAKDTSGQVSDWGYFLTIVPKDIQPTPPKSPLLIRILQRIIDRFPGKFPIIEMILG